MKERDIYKKIIIGILIIALIPIYLISTKNNYKITESTFSGKKDVIIPDLDHIHVKNCEYYYRDVLASNGDILILRDDNKKFELKEGDSLTITLDGLWLCNEIDKEAMLYNEFLYAQLIDSKSIPYTKFKNTSPYATLTFKPDKPGKYEVALLNLNPDFVWFHHLVVKINKGV